MTTVPVHVQASRRSPVARAMLVLCAASSFLGGGCDVLIGLGDEPGASVAAGTGGAPSTSSASASGAGGSGGNPITTADGVTVTGVGGQGGGAGPGGGGGAGGACEGCVDASAVDTDGLTCALLEGGAVRCWGPNGEGQLGLGNTIPIGDDERPTLDVVLDDSNPPTFEVVEVAVGSAHACARSSEGVIVCWGSGSEGQLGTGAQANVGDNEPPWAGGIAPLPLPATQVVAGSAHSCALLTDGSVWCWGRGENGQLGDDTFQASYVPVATEPVLDAVALAAGDDHTCALLEDQVSVSCWGEGDDGRLGLGSLDDRPVPSKTVVLPTNVLSLSAGRAHTCAVIDGGVVWCWGDAAPSGHPTDVGDNEAVDADAGPVDLGVGADVAESVAAGAEHTCVVMVSGVVRCWGYGADGRLGVETRADVPVVPSAAVEVDAGAAVLQVSAGVAQTCALLDGGDVACWGSGAQGRLGYGDTEDVGDDETPAEAGPVL